MSESNWRPEMPADKEAVRRQLERILAHPAFKSSHRGSKLLRYIVEYGLQEDFTSLKERTLGLEVFGRDAGYDTSQDPVVRNAAADLRKRIAQYYHSPEHEAEIRIDLPPGSYIPVFGLPEQELPEFETAKAVQVSSPAPVAASPGRAESRRRSLLVGAVAAGLLALLAIAGLSWLRFQPHNARDRFWQPLIKPGNPVMLFVSGTSSAAVCRSGLPQDTTTMTFAASQIIRYLDRRGQAFDLRPADETKLTDLRSGPAVILSTFGDLWTGRMLQPLRFHFSTDSTWSIWIDDSTRPSFKDWSLPAAGAGSARDHDYAIVTRFWDASAGHHVIVASGACETGAFAAAELLTQPASMEELLKSAPAHWKSRNIEAVISTQVIDGKAVSPQILAVEYW